MIKSVFYLLKSCFSKIEQIVMKWIVFMVLCFTKGRSSTIDVDATAETTAANVKEPVNNRPIIGILSQELTPYFKKKIADDSIGSYIAASYVKGMESSGARVVPIFIGKDYAYYKDLLSKLNGVLFPGGASYFNVSNGYADAGRLIYQIAKEFNDAGDHFPLFGTCLGFELLVVITTEPFDGRTECHSFSNSRLQFASDFNNSKMYKDAPDDIIHILTHEDVVVNAHQLCFLSSTSKKLSENWKILSYSRDENQTEFISSVEHNIYPFYGVQFHPEKSMFEWKATKYYAHNKNAIAANRYFMDFFVDECRKNMHTFADSEEENCYLIYKYLPKFTGKHSSAFEQTYLFHKQIESIPHTTVQV